MSVKEKSESLTNKERCAICELKQLVDKIGKSVNSSNCTSCNQINKNFLQPPTITPGGQSPPPVIPYMPQPQTQQAAYYPAYYPQPMPTYQWPQYTSGMYWPPQQQSTHSLHQNREQTYLPVQVEVPTEQINKPKILNRSKSANFVAKKSTELRPSVRYSCDCGKKNGLQDTCPKIICTDIYNTSRKSSAKRETILEEVNIPIKIDEQAKGDFREQPVKDVGQKPETSPPCKQECQAK